MKIILDREFLILALEIEEQQAKYISTIALNEKYLKQAEEFKQNVIKGVVKNERL